MIEPTVAVKPTVETPDAAVTLAGTVAFPLLLERVTASPPTGAAPLKVTVQADVPGAFTFDGAQDRLLGVTTAGAVKVTVVFTDAAFSVAVTVADWLLGMVPAVAVNVPLADPLPTVMLDGTGNSALLLERLTAVLLGAVLFRVTVQVVV